MKDLQETLNLHKKWLINEPDGQKANLSSADLSSADLSSADLRYADLSSADLRYANLRYADLRYADLSSANLSSADLSSADLRYADLRYANLSSADLRYADLRYADLRYADLSSAEGLLSAIEYLEANFEKTTEGYIAYKTFNSEYKPPEKWVIQPDSIITENINFDRTRDCGCGINVAPLSWVKKQYGHKGHIWKVLIKWEWLAGVCVPYMTDGKIRCEKVQLIGVVE